MEHPSCTRRAPRWCRHWFGTLLTWKLHQLRPRRFSEKPQSRWWKYLQVQNPLCFTLVSFYLPTSLAKRFYSYGRFCVAGKLEHVAAGAATCLQALVESEKWKHATMELVSEVCHQTTTALGDKSTRTVAHVQLAISLATINPSILSVYGACLLHVGEEVLNGRANSWQHRKYAAKMVQAVVAIVDKDTLALELSSIMQVVEHKLSVCSSGS